MGATPRCVVFVLAVSAAMAAPPGKAGGSYYLKHLRTDGLEVDVMSPQVITPRPGDRLLPDVPDT